MEGTRSTDAKGRMCLPKAFAKRDGHHRPVERHRTAIRKAVVLPQDDVRLTKRRPHR